ncbi:hypothetical protein HDU77_010733 [Chytriomyces hyalinus]|nr:hypothetical protein HDU77_010733 [Chytriomyces hyalinus]
MQPFIHDDHFAQVHGGLQCRSCGVLFKRVSIPFSVARRHFESRKHVEKTEAAAIQLTGNQVINDSRGAIGDNNDPHGVFGDNNNVNSHGALGHNNVNSHGALGHNNVNSHGALGHNNVNSHGALGHNNVNSHGALGHNNVNSHGALGHNNVNSHSALGHNNVNSHGALGHNDNDDSHSVVGDNNDPHSVVGDNNNVNSHGALGHNNVNSHGALGDNNSHNDVGDNQLTGNQVIIHSCGAIRDNSHSHGAVGDNTGSAGNDSDDTHADNTHADNTHADNTHASDRDATHRNTTNVAETGNTDADDTDDSDFSMSSQVLSEDDPSDIEASDFEVDPVPEARPDEGWDFMVDTSKFTKGNHFPFKSNLEFKLLSLFSGVGATKFSRNQQAGVLNTYSNVPGTPTLGRMRSLSADIRALLNISPKLYDIGDKHVYYIPIQQTIRLAFANPRIRSQLHTLPSLQKISSELYHSGKWFEEIPTPMFRVQRGNGFYDIFAGEAYHLEEDRVRCIVPLTFAATEDGSTIACGKKAMINNGCLIVKDDKDIVCVSRISSAVDLQAVRAFQFGQSISTYLTQTVQLGSPLRIKADGRQVFSVPLTLFNDDTSGNVSKKWNKYESWLFTLAGLPFKATQQQENINFICTAKDASAIETAEIIVHCMRELRNGIVVYDAMLKEEVLVTGDNPAQSSIVSHSGLASSKPCRICNIGTPSSPDLLQKFLLLQGASTLNTFMHLKHKLLNWKQLVLEKHLPPATVLQETKSACIKDYHFNKFLDNHFSSPPMNPLLGTTLEIPFIVGALDTPIEILHCVLLGIVKYLLRATVEGLSTDKKQELKACLEGVWEDGLPSKIYGHTMVHHVKSLNGKDFRLFVQVAPFALSNVVAKELHQTWVSLSHLAAHLYMSHIDVTPYNLDFTKHMDQFVFHASKTPYFYEVVKPKLHLLCHIPDFTRRFGPPRLCATEAFESSNKIIRNCISHTSRQNPSRDVSMQFANNLAVQHLVDGGAFQMEQTFHSNNSLMSTRGANSSSTSVLKPNQFVCLDRDQPIFLKVTSVATLTATGMEFTFSGQYHLDCPIIVPSQRSMSFHCSDALVINVQHCCSGNCTVSKKRGSHVDSHKFHIRHTQNETVCINIYHFRTRRAVSRFIPQPRGILNNDLEDALALAFVEPKRRGRPPSIKKNIISAQSNATMQE